MTTPALENFERQAKSCASMGSPFTASVCLLLRDLVDRGSAFGRKLLDWPETAGSDAVALRACGALHALARSGEVPELAAVYPPNAVSGDQLRTAIEGAIAEKDQFLADYLDSPPQTNEVARSAILLGGLLTVAAQTGLPLELIEIGSSAGLNLMADQYRYDLGEGREWAPEDAPLSIACNWAGAIPDLSQALRVVSRQGCDRNPLDASSSETVERLLSYVWADQIARKERLAAALGFVARSGIRIKQADAADFVEERLAAPQEPGTARVLMHTVVWQYLAPQVRTRIEAALEVAGARASAAMPLAHLAFEADDKPNGGAISLTLWPHKRQLSLGRADFHGRWAEWSVDAPGS